MKKGFPSVSKALSRRRQKQQNRTSVQQLDYATFEPRHLLAGDFFGAVNIDPIHEQTVLAKIAGYGATAYLQQGDNSLEVVGHNGAATVLQQTFAGLPVHNAFVTVVDGVTGRDNGIHDGGFENLQTQNDIDPDLSLDDAKAIAATDFGGQGVDQATGQQIWYFTGGQARLAWQIDLSVDVDGSTVDYTSIVDANSGSIFNVEETGNRVEYLLENPTVETGVYPRIVINNAIGAQGSRDYAAPFDAVGAMSVGCTGTLIAPDVVISARHCGLGGGQSVTFGDNSNNGVYTASIASVSLPDGNGSLLDGGDVAIVTLTADVPSNIATPVKLVDATTELEGSVAATLGYGYNGLGSAGHGFTADGWRWGGENIIDVYGTPASSSGSNIFSTDFDDGSSGSNTIGSSSAMPLTFEATTAPGDSGGPLMVQVNNEWVIAGVLSGGTTNTSVYGDISWWTGTSIYRSQIEAAGGVFVDDTGAQIGTVELDQSSYAAGDSVGITVTDTNGITPLQVTIVSDSGDSETLTLSAAGGSNYTGSIVTSDSGVNAGDGTLQVSIGDTITVTYNDPDDGNGGTGSNTDAANIIDPSIAVLVGIDFDGNGNPTPGNWTRVGGGSNTTVSDLINEEAGATTFDLTIVDSADGSWESFDVTPIASTVPQHANALGNIDGQIYTAADPMVLTYSDLTPGTDYEVYVMAAEGFYASISQRVTITGDGTPVVFDQVFNQNELFVNDQLGDSTRSLAEYAQVITADANGEIVINLDPINGTDDVVLAGVAISEVAEDHQCDPGVGGEVVVDVAPLNFGIAVADSAAGTGYFMYSEQAIQNRFGNAVNPNNAAHILAVRLNGSQWQYSNRDALGWVDFTTTPSDRLLAEVDFSADTVTLLEGTDSTIGGVSAGYTSSDLAFTPNQWNGLANDDEFGVTGTSFAYTATSSNTSVAPLNFGVAAADSATGTGYLMYSSQTVQTRFGSAVNSTNAAHIVAVRLNGSQWQFTNRDSTGWVDFTPAANDRLLAEVDFSADTVTSLEGTDSTIGGIAAGYDSGDLVYTANQWNGSANNGEFGVTGTSFSTAFTSQISLTPLNFGVAAMDSATGTGYMMYSQQGVQARFGNDVNATNAAHILAVRLNGSQWQFTNRDSAGWINFTPVASDLLLAEVDFSADTVTSLEGVFSNIGGIAAGYESGDIVFTANQWNGSTNSGEFGVTGSFIDPGCDQSSARHMVGNSTDHGFEANAVKPISAVQPIDSSLANQDQTRSRFMFATTDRPTVEKPSLFNAPIGFDFQAEQFDVLQLSGSLELGAFSKLDAAFSGSDQTGNEEVDFDKIFEVEFDFDIV